MNKQQQQQLHKRININLQFIKLFTLVAIYIDTVERGGGRKERIVHIEFACTILTLIRIRLPIKCLIKSRRSTCRRVSSIQMSMRNLSQWQSLLASHLLLPTSGASRRRHRCRMQIGPGTNG